MICLSLLSSMFSTHFFLNLSKHFYFPAPVHENIYFKVINDLHIAIVICQNAHLPIISCWFFFSGCDFSVFFASFFPSLHLYTS